MANEVRAKQAVISGEEYSGADVMRKVLVVEEPVSASHHDDDDTGTTAGPEGKKPGSLALYESVANRGSAEQSAVGGIAVQSTLVLGVEDAM